MNVDLVFKIAGLGILISIFNIVLEQANKEEQAEMLTLVGVIIVLMIVIRLINDLFTNVRQIFGF
ncbi:MULTISPECIES: stage III sporulation protein AC [unclassified Candidatus Frackibacter]|uniref:stage III sporulation protein AC n=1 Tax=unclassified Candidatus Frackibacter TaxID=2648818 RepID=UPI00079C91E6|nr:MULTISPECIES: stage III sporulation protein AC [unclassified Candidatus Frackibacter]KXS45948.1 MAG: stage III sporulation protein AC [Candidatus Frackibacter sp. T328-2]SDC03132.1 stage III sporulation protein AC [Candidatus Frackibacter sp. WG11]SEM69232.1 stage III sporulation protein AC [Candidatus Frackibacter sp. WG12]SFL80510.1 stage III sporulation protein AC [Candidatus Frackibacter sp. WG13]